MGAISELYLPFAYFTATSVYYFSLILMVAALLIGYFTRIFDRRRKRLLALCKITIKNVISHGDVKEIKWLISSNPYYFLVAWSQIFKNACEEEKIILTEIADDIGLGKIAIDGLHSSHYFKQYSIQALGQLKEKQAYEDLKAIVMGNNFGESILAFQSLILIDTNNSIPWLADQLIMHFDWPVEKVLQVLTRAPYAVVVRIIMLAFQRAPLEEVPRLITYLMIVQEKDRQAVINEYLKSDNQPEIISKALRHVDNESYLEIVHELACHDIWYVRLQAAKALGRIGFQSSVPHLVDLLHDQRELVAYRAAESLVIIDPKIHNRKNEFDRLSLQAEDVLTLVLQERGLS